jgi:hypothetical protein
MLRFRMKKTLVSLAAGVMPSLGGVLAITTPAHADPIDCTITADGWPGIQTFTLHIDGNPCRVPLRAWVDCDGWGGVATGSTTSANFATSVADCGWIRGVDPYGDWGYDMYAYGAWHRYDMHTGEWRY